MKKNRLYKNIIIFGFLFLFPVLGPVTPEFHFTLGAVNSDMLWLFLISLMSVYLFMAKKKNVISKTFVLLCIYYTFLLLNSWINGNFQSIVKTEIALFISSCLAIFLIDNLEYEKRDLKIIYKLMYLLVIITLVGSLLQFFIDPSLFTPSDRYKMLSKIDFSGFWRNSSIFDSLIQNQGGIFFIFLLFLFLTDYEKSIESRRLIASAILLVIGFFSFSRYIIVSQLLIVLFFLFFKVFKSPSKLPTTLYLSVLLILIGTLFFDTIVKSDFVQVRLLADISGRTTDPFDFLKMFLGEHNILTGTGASSYILEYFYGNIRRYHSGIWDLFFQGGLIGLILWFLIVYQFFKKSIFIYKNSGGKIFLLVAPLIIFINFTARLNHFFYLGFIFIYLLMNIHIDLIKKRIQSIG